MTRPLGVRSPAALLVLALGILGVVGFHGALFSSGFDRIPGDEGDARTAVYLVEHWYQVFRGRADALSPGMFYPVKGTLAYTDTMLLHALPYSLLRWAGLDMFSALAVPLALVSLLNYLACFVLLHRELRLHPIASAAGAAFFAFGSPRLNHTGHLNFQTSFFLPVAALFVIRFLRNADTLTRRRALSLLAAAGLCVILQLVVSLHQGWLFAFWSLLLVALAAALPSTRRAAAGIIRRLWPAVTGAAVVLALGVLPLLAIYLPAARVVGPRRYGLVEPLIPRGWSLLYMGKGNYVWGGVSAALTRLHPLPSTEHAIGIGLVPSLTWLLLTAWALVTVGRRASSRSPDSRRPDASAPDLPRECFPLMILATSLFYAIGMTYGGVSPWRLVYLAVPGADSLRAVARYVVVLALPMAIAFAVVVDWAMRHIAARRGAPGRRWRAAALAAPVAFGLVEQFGRTPSISKTAELARLRRLAATLPDDCASFYVAPAPGRRPGKHEDQIDAMLISVVRHVPTLNGYSGHVPPGWALREVDAPDYEQRVEWWIAQHELPGKICRLAIGDEPAPRPGTPAPPTSERVSARDVGGRIP